MADMTFDTVAQGFDAADAAARAAIESANAPEAPTPSPVTPAAPAPAAQTPVVPEVPAGPKVVNLNDDDVVEILQNGQVVQRAWKDAKASTMMHADYTRKTQEVAAAKRELET